MRVIQIPTEPRVIVPPEVIFILKYNEEGVDDVIGIVIDDVNNSGKDDVKLL